MKKFFVNALIVVVLAFIIQWMFIKYVPDIVYKIAVHRSDKPCNQWINAGKTDAGMRQVVMPNPDFVYSAFFYDVNEKDVVVSGVLPDSGYASVAFYDDRCQPYFVYNNLSRDHTGNFSLTLSHQESTGPHEIQAKTNKGVLICRFLVKGDSALQKMKDYQSQLTSEVK
jgi:hypothetical protein